MDILDFFRRVTGKEEKREIPAPSVPHGTAPWSAAASAPKPPWDGGPLWSRSGPREPLEVPDSMTVAEARARLYEKTHVEGIAKCCPVCDHLDQVYMRRFHREAVMFVQQLVRLWNAEQNWHHMEAIVPGGAKHASDGSYLGVHYGLCQRMSNTDDRPSEGRSTGYYQPTRFGIEFVEGNLEIPEFVLVSNRGNTVAGWSESRMTLAQALQVDVDMAG